MQLSKIISKKLIFLDHSFERYDQVIDFASQQLAKATAVPVSTIKNSFIAREHIGTTFMGHRLALPHAYIDTLDQIVVLFIRLGQQLPVDIGNRTYVVKYVFAILTSKTNTQTYLKILSSVARLVIHKTFILDEAKSPDHFISLLEKNDTTIDEKLIAKDLITSHVYVPADATISHAVDIMNKHNVTFLPVVDQNRILKGIIDLSDLLKAAFPDEIIDSVSMDFIKDMGATTNLFFEPLTHFWENKDKKLVRDFMRDAADLTVKEDARYIDVVFLVTKNHYRHLVVTSGAGEVLGIIDTYDIIHMVIRG